MAIVKTIAPLILIGGTILAGWIAFDRLSGRQFAIAPGSDARFPTVSGSNLAGDAFVLPQDIEGEYAIAMIAFQQWQQRDINTWIPTAQDLSLTYGDSLAYYEFPTIERLNALSRAFIDGGMRAGIPDPVARSITITLYLDKPAFQQALDIDGDAQIVVLVIDREGKVYHREVGRATAESDARLRAAVAALLD